MLMQNSLMNVKNIIIIASVIESLYFESMIVDRTGFMQCSCLCVCVCQQSRTGCWCQPWRWFWFSSLLWQLFTSLADSMKSPRLIQCAGHRSATCGGKIQSMRIIYVHAFFTFSFRIIKAVLCDVMNWFAKLRNFWYHSKDERERGAS